MALYENTFIGSFLYGLGLEVGASSHERPLVTGVDLLQQTPLDRSLADLLIKAPEYVSIIEFKRRENRSDKEVNKRNWLIRMINVSGNALRLAQISRAMHFQVDLVNESDKLIIRLRSYIDEESTAQTTDLPHLCRWFSKAMQQPPSAPSPEERSHYLTFLRTAYGAESASGGGGSVLIVSANAGLIRHAVIDDLRDFYRTQRQILALQQELDRHRERHLYSPEPNSRSRQRRDPEKENTYSGPER